VLIVLFVGGCTSFSISAARQQLVKDNMSKAEHIAAQQWQVERAVFGVSAQRVAYADIRIVSGEESYRLLAYNGDEGFSILDRVRVSDKMRFVVDIMPNLNWHNDFGTKENAFFLLKLHKEPTSKVNRPES